MLSPRGSTEEHLTTDQRVVGSNPIVDDFLFHMIFFHTHTHTQQTNKMQFAAPSTSSTSSNVNSQAVFTGRSLGGFSEGTRGDGTSGRSLLNNVDGSDFVYSGGLAVHSDRFQVMSGSMEGNVDSSHVISSRRSPTRLRQESEPILPSSGGPKVIIARKGNRQVVEMKPKMNASAAPYVVNLSSPGQGAGLSSSSPSFYAEMMPTAVNFQSSPPTSQPPQHQFPPPELPQQLHPQQPLHYDPLLGAGAQSALQYNHALYQMQAFQLQQQFLYSQQFAQVPPPPPMYTTDSTFGGNTAALADAFGRLSVPMHVPHQSDEGGYKTRSRRGGVKARQRAAARRAWEEEAAKAAMGEHPPQNGASAATVKSNDDTTTSSGGTKPPTSEPPKPPSSEPQIDRSRNSERSTNASHRNVGSDRARHESKNDSSRSRDSNHRRSRRQMGSKRSNDDGIDSDLEDALDIAPTVQLIPTRPLLKTLAKECKPRPPWFCGYPFAGCSGADAPTLTEELIAFSRFVSPAPPEFERLSFLFNKCLGVFKRMWPSCEFRLASITAAGVVPPKGCPLQVYAVHTHNFDVAIAAGDPYEQQAKDKKKKKDPKYESNRSEITSDGSGRPLGSSQPSDMDQILEKLLALPPSAVPKAFGSKDVGGVSVHDASPPEETLYLPFAPLQRDCISRIASSADKISVGTALQVEGLIRSHIQNANLECTFHVDARECPVVVISDPDESLQIAVRYGPRAVLSEKTAILLRRQIAHNHHARLALCALEALLRQNNLVDNDGTKPTLLSVETLAVLMLIVVRTRQMDRHSSTRSPNTSSPHPIPHAGGLLNSFLHYFGQPANFNPTQHTADYMSGLQSPSKKLHPNDKFSVCDPSDDVRIHVSYLSGVFHAPVDVPGVPASVAPAIANIAEINIEAPPPRNLAASNPDTRHLSAVLNYCYAAMEAHESSSPSKRKAQSVLSTIIGGEAYWGRVMDLYENVVEPWYGVVHHLRRILAKSLTESSS